MRILTAFGDYCPHNLSPAGQYGGQSVVLVERMTNPNGDHDNVRPPLPRTIFRYHGFGHPSPADPVRRSPIVWAKTMIHP